MKKKKLYKSRTDKKLCGVCGGLGEYVDIDPVIIRLIWVLMTLFVGFGLIAYIIAALIIPKEPVDKEPEKTTEPEQEQPHARGL